MEPSTQTSNYDDPQVATQAANLTKAIFQHESGMDYNAVGDAGTSHGAGQWQPATWKAQAKDVLGDENAPMTQANQSIVAQGTIRKLIASGKNAAQIAAIWNSGSDENWENKVGTTSINGQQVKYNVPQYVKSVTDLYQQYKGGDNSSPTQEYQPPTQAGQQPLSGAPVQGYAPPQAPQQPQAQPAAQPTTDQSGGFLSGLQEDLQGTNPNSLGTQLENTAKGVGNFLFPIAGDVKNDLTGQNDKSALQQAGDLGLSVLPFIPGLGEIGEGARGVEAGAEAGGSIGKLLGSTVAKGAATGYGAGTLSNLSNGQSIGQAITPNSANIGAALTGGVAGKVLPGLMSKNMENAALQKSIQDVMPLENKATRIDALRNSLPGNETGGVTRKGMFGTSTIVPNDEDVQRGMDAHPYVSGTNDPTVKIKNLNKGIQDASKKVDTFLDEKSAPANFADMRNYMETNRPTSNISKDPAAMENYNRATQDALDTLYKTMKDSANTTGDFSEKTTGADIRKARIAIDQQISKELGENTFGTPQYKGIKAAEIDTRNLLNRMSEDMLRYPGQMENLNKMNDFIGTSRQRGISIDLDDPQVRSELENRFGLSSTPEHEQAAQALANAHSHMSNLYESRDNLIDKYQRKIGKNKVQEAIDNNPVAKVIANTAKKAIPFGVADHVL